ncbi:hypothetical protein GCM10028784_08950 [Myceligenerans cantabricum]
MTSHDDNQDGAMLRRMRAVSGAITLPPVLDGATMAAAAVRKVRRRRVVAAVGGGVAGVLVLAALALAVTGDPLAGTRVLPGGDDKTTAPPSTPSTEPSAASAAEPVQPPKGWTPVQFYGLSYAMPQGWEATDPLDSWMYYGEQYWVGPGDAQRSFTVQISETIEAEPLDETVHREFLDIPGAVTGELVVGFPPLPEGLPENAPPERFRQEVAVLTFQQSGGLWYTARFGVDAQSEVDVLALAHEFAGSLALTTSVQDVRASLGEYSDALPVREVRRNTPEAWEVVEAEGLRFALPPEVAEDDSWDELGPEQAAQVPDGARGWTTPDGTAAGRHARVRFFPVPGSSLVAPESGAETVDIDGAGRVDVRVYEEPTSLTGTVDVWDRELRHGWSLTFSWPATPEGRQDLAIFLGSVRIVS